MLLGYPNLRSLSTINDVPEFRRCEWSLRPDGSSARAIVHGQFDVFSAKLKQIKQRIRARLPAEWTITFRVNVTIVGDADIRHLARVLADNADVNISVLSVVALTETSWQSLMSLLRTRARLDEVQFSLPPTDHERGVLPHLQGVRQLQDLAGKTREVYVRGGMLALQDLEGMQPLLRRFERVDIPLWSESMIDLALPARRKDLGHPSAQITTQPSSTRLIFRVPVSPDQAIKLRSAPGWVRRLARLAVGVIGIAGRVDIELTTLSDIGCTGERV